MQFHRQETPNDSVSVPPQTFDLANLLVQNVARQADGTWTTAYGKLEIVKVVNNVWRIECMSTQSLLKAKQLVEWLSERNGVKFL